MSRNAGNIYAVILDKCDINKVGDMKALALLSGGLDSTLATKLILDQGINVVALNFASPFSPCERRDCEALRAARRLKVSLRTINWGEDYLRIIRKPKHGYGKNMNPCIDCRIYMLKKAKEYARKIGALFIFTGEVLDERPMSQHSRAFEIIEKETKLEGKILRPLSAKLLPKTEAEKKRLVDREKLLDIKGRSRKRQMELAREYGIRNYPWPAGGCLLTYKEFANKVKDLFEHKERILMKDIRLLKIGRHFRFEKNKIIVGRNKHENKLLKDFKDTSDYCFEVSSCGSPITLLQGPKTKEAIELAAGLTARYSDSMDNETIVKYCSERINKSLIVSKPSSEDIEASRIN